MVELFSDVSNKYIYDIQYLLHCKVAFEPPRPKCTIPQCANCQQYGHTKAYCHRIPKCVNPEHLTSDVLFVTIIIPQTKAALFTSPCGRQDLLHLKSPKIFK